MIRLHTLTPGLPLLAGLAALSLGLLPGAAQAMTGSAGTPGNAASGNGVAGSFVFNDPAAAYQGGPGGPGGSVPLNATTVLGETGGVGGDGAATGGNGSHIVVQSGTFTGGDGGQGGVGTIGGDGGNGGNAISFGPGVTASVFGGVFQPGQPGPNAAQATTSGSPGASFYIDGSNVTLYGTFDVAPQTIFFGSGTFVAQLANNSAPAMYSYIINNTQPNFNGSLTLVPEASTTVSFGLLLALGGAALAARRKKIAA